MVDDSVSISVLLAIGYEKQPIDMFQTSHMFVRITF